MRYLPTLLLLALPSTTVSQALPTTAPRDAAVVAAEAALAAGRAWEASRLLEPVLGTAARRTPGAVLLAARAAAGWGGWVRVEALLSRAVWLDIDFGGDGRELLARAAIARNRSSLASLHAHAALRASVNDSVRNVRLLLTARALERSEQYDSAATLYLLATRSFPAIAEWLTLRAAGATRDSATRAEWYRSLRLPAARGRIGWTEALAFTRARQSRSSAREYALLGTPVTALGQRLDAVETAAERTRLRKELLDLLTPRLSNGETRSAIELLDRTFRPLTPLEELVVARRAAGAGSLARAAKGYAAAAAGGVLTQNDRYSWGTVLVRLGRESEAIAQFDRVTEPTLRGQASYQRARALLRGGEGAAAASELVRIPERFPGDVEAASSALYLGADLRTDAGEDAKARELFLRIARKYPTSRFVDRARFRAAMIAFVLGNTSEAAEEFDALARDKPDGDEASASQYWAGRARYVLGDTVGGMDRLAALARRQDGMYYVTLAAVALNQLPWIADTNIHRFTVPIGVQAAIARTRLLRHLGLATEARFETDQLVQEGNGSVDLLLGTAQGLADDGQVSPAMRLASRAVSQGAPRTVALYRLLYPFPQQGVLQIEAQRHGLDPYLVAGLIRQESAFDPMARSIADARGLMQVLPRLGAEIAQDIGIAPWDVALLYDPEVSITFGTRHMAEVARTYASTERLLATYNAGAHRVVGWETKSGMSADPTLFVERIPFVETRDYVRRVISNRTIYHLLYGGSNRSSTERLP